MYITPRIRIGVHPVIQREVTAQGFDGMSRGTAAGILLHVHGCTPAENPLGDINCALYHMYVYSGLTIITTSYYGVIQVCA